MDDARDVLFEVRDDGIGWVTLNRPASLNSLSTHMQQMLGDVVSRCDQDPAVRVVVITGAGRGFCSGGDVRSQVERRQATAAARVEGGAPLPDSFEPGTAQLFHNQMRSVYTLYTMSKPAIAAVNGAAAGAGLSIALACDLRLASDRAKFTTAFRSVGLSGDYGGAYFLPRLVGEAVARDLYFTGRIIDAEEARAIGLVGRVVPHDDLEAETMALARQLADGPVGAYARMKRNLALAAKGDLAAVLHSEAVGMGLSGLSADAAEAGRAFVEKRKPSFIRR